MTLNPSVDLGQILTMAGMAVVAIGAHYTIRTELRLLKDVVKELGLRLDRHERIVFEMAGNLQRVIGTLDAQVVVHQHRKDNLA